MSNLVIFNVEGTLIDSVKATVLSWHEAFKQFGYEFTVPQLQRFAGTNPVEMVRSLVPATDADGIASSLCRAHRAYFQQEHLKDVKPIPAARLLLDRIDRLGFEIAIVGQCTQEQLRYYVRLANVSGFVDIMACLDDVAGDDPLLELIKFVLAQAGMSADDAIMIGSTPSDAIAAQRTGLRAIGLPSSGFSEHELTDAGCVAVHRSLAALLNSYFAFRPGVSGRREPA